LDKRFTLKKVKNGDDMEVDAREWRDTASGLPHEGKGSFHFSLFPQIIEPYQAYNLKFLPLNLLFFFNFHPFNKMY
jgi:hypothetical protein